MKLMTKKDKEKLISLIQELSMSAQELGEHSYISCADFEALEDWKIAEKRHNKVYKEIIDSLR